MNTDIKVDFEKKVYWSISRIESFHKEKAFRIINNKFTINEAIATIKKEKDEGFVCKIFLDQLHDITFNQNIEKFGIFEEIIFETTGDIYSIRKDSARSIDLTLSSPQVLTLHLDHFQSGLVQDFDNKKQRLVIPVDIDPTFDLIEFKSVKINSSITFCGLLQISINNFTYHLFKYKNDDTKRNYLIIDSNELNTFLEFKTNTKAIITAYGYLSGNLFLDEYYYQTFKDEELDMVENILYEKNEKSALTDMSLLNPFRFKEYIKAIGKNNELKNTQLWMPASIFSRMCRTIISNETYSRCCILIIEGNQSNQLLLRASIYSIALETLTNIIYEENTLRINPIPDKKLAKLLRDKIFNILDEYKEFLTDYGMKVLSSKINDINNPTNAKKLSVPFEIYRIKLSKDDLEILDHRNKFLHGTSPFSEEELKHKEKEIRFITSRLQFMLNSLMLKYIGYTGHIINYPAWIQYNNKEKVTDHLFRII